MVEPPPQWCPAVNTLLIGNDLVPAFCRRERGHVGECDDGAGHRWLRYTEHLRQRALTPLRGTREAALGVNMGQGAYAATDGVRPLPDGDAA